MFFDKNTRLFLIRNHSLALYMLLQYEINKLIISAVISENDICIRMILTR